MADGGGRKWQVGRGRGRGECGVRRTKVRRGRGEGVMRAGRADGSGGGGFERG